MRSIITLHDHHKFSGTESSISLEYDINSQLQDKQQFILNNFNPSNQMTHFHDQLTKQAAKHRV